MRPVNTNLDASSSPIRKRGFIEHLVYVSQQVLPDPFVLAIGLTIVVALCAAAFAPNGSAQTIFASWFQGVFGIFTFALQMIMILVTGYAIADAPVVRTRLAALAASISSPTRAALVVFPVVGAATWLNWGLGLVVGAFLAREVAKRAPVDFAWLVAGTYAAWGSFANSGLSGSVALSQASHNNPLNLVEKATGNILPLSETVFAPFVYVPSVVILLATLVFFIWIHPKPGHEVRSREAYGEADDLSLAQERESGTLSFAQRVERSVWGSWLLVIMGLGYLATTWSKHHFEIDINTTILIFLLVGLVLQRRPIAYANAVVRAAGQTGGMMLQYPIYGGMMGIMSGTGLAGVIANGFVAIATPATLALWSYVSSLVITLLIPSAGGHWAVQGPFVLPAAVEMHASLARTAMAVAVGENSANMLQPFWAVPLVALAGVRIQSVMGYTACIFVISAVCYMLGLWLIP